MAVPLVVTLAACNQAATPDPAPPVTTTEGLSGAPPSLQYPAATAPPSADPGAGGAASAAPVANASDAGSVAPAPTMSAPPPPIRIRHGNPPPPSLSLPTRGESH